MQWSPCFQILHTFLLRINLSRCSIIVNCRKERNYLLIEILWSAIWARRKEYYGSSFILIRPSGDGNTAILRITYARSELWKQLIWTSSRYNAENRYVVVDMREPCFPPNDTRDQPMCIRGDLSMDRLSESRAFLVVGVVSFKKDKRPLYPVFMKKDRALTTPAWNRALFLLDTQ